MPEQLNIVIALLLTSLAAAFTYMDVRYRRIPNTLVLVTFIGGVTLNTIFSGSRGFIVSLEGFALAFGLMFFLHAFGTMGAGDVKLAAALGCIIGPAGSWQVMFATAVAGGALAILVMIFTGRVLKTLRSTLAVVGFHAVHGLRTHPDVNLDNPAAVRLPYGLAFAAGTLYWAFLMPMWR